MKYCIGQVYNYSCSLYKLKHKGLSPFRACKYAVAIGMAFNIAFHEHYFLQEPIFF